MEPGESVEAAALRELKVAVAQLFSLFTIAHLRTGRGRYKCEAGPMWNVYLPTRGLRPYLPDRGVQGRRIRRRANRVRPLSRRLNDLEGLTHCRTEEMRPEWFDVPDSVEQNSPIPWERMWADDRYWYPIMLSSKYFVGRVDFSESVEDGDEKYTLQRWWFGVRDT